MAGLAIQEGDGNQATDPAKRIRNLKKKLTQIQQLRDKSKGGAKLEAEQQAKIDSETSIIDELKSLGEAWED